MHYYQFNIGDYSSHTSRLSVLEDLAYRRLLDLYYLTERPLNGCSTDVARDVGLTDYQSEVDYILGKFFTKDGDNWLNNRADKEIKAYHSKQKSASKAGKASGKARQLKANERALSDRSTDVQPNNKHKTLTKNQEPLTSNHKTENKKQGLKDTTADAIFDYWQSVMGKQQSRLTVNRKTKIKARLKHYSEDQIKSAIDGCSKSEFHMGKNDQKTEYNDIELICRNDENVEKFITKNVSESRVDNQLQDWIND